MSWLDDAKALLSDDDEQEQQPFDALSSDWRKRARAMLSQPDPPKPSAVSTAPPKLS